jgi:hypothetical protein
MSQGTGVILSFCICHSLIWNLVITYLSEKGFSKFENSAFSVQSNANLLSSYGSNVHLMDLRFSQQ